MIFRLPRRVALDSDRDRQEPRRPLASDRLENAYYRLSIDRATGRVSLFDKELNQEVCRDMEVAALEERGGNYIGIEPPAAARSMARSRASPSRRRTRCGR